MSEATDCGGLKGQGRRLPLQQVLAKDAEGPFAPGSGLEELPYQIRPQVHLSDSIHAGRVTECRSVPRSDFCPWLVSATCPLSHAHRSGDSQTFGRGA